MCFFTMWSLFIYLWFISFPNTSSVIYRIESKTNLNFQVLHLPHVLINESMNITKSSTLKQGKKTKFFFIILLRSYVYRVANNVEWSPWSKLLSIKKALKTITYHVQSQNLQIFSSNGNNTDASWRQWLNQIPHSLIWYCHVRELWNL